MREPKARTCFYPIHKPHRTAKKMGNKTVHGGQTLVQRNTY